MFTRNSALSVVFVLSFMAGFCSPSFALPVKIYGRDDFNLPIPADPAKSLGLMKPATIEITDDFIIKDINVFITIEHTNVFDLHVYLEGPGQTRICLNMYDFKDSFFIGAGYIRTIFDDEAPVAIEQGKAPFTGRYKPKAVGKDNLLSTFDGRNLAGVWKLQVEDMYYSDTGSLKSFKLFVTVPEPVTAVFFTLGAIYTVFFSKRR